MVQRVNVGKKREGLRVEKRDKGWKKGEGLRMGKSGKGLLFKANSAIC